MLVCFRLDFLLDLLTSAALLSVSVMSSAALDAAAAAGVDCLLFLLLFLSLLP